MHRVQSQGVSVDRPARREHVRDSVRVLAPLFSRQASLDLIDGAAQFERVRDSRHPAKRGLTADFSFEASDRQICQRRKGGNAQIVERDAAVVAGRLVLHERRLAGESAVEGVTLPFEDDARVPALRPESAAPSSEFKFVPAQVPNIPRAFQFQFLQRVAPPRGATRRTQVESGVAADPGTHELQPRKAFERPAIALDSEFHVAAVRFQRGRGLQSRTAAHQGCVPDFESVRLEHRLRTQALEAFPEETRGSQLDPALSPRLLQCARDCYVHGQRAIDRPSETAGPRELARVDSGRRCRYIHLALLE